MIQGIMGSVCFSILVLTLIIKLGVPQTINITSSSTSPIVCETESIEYKCTSASTRVQWIAKPVINATGNSVVNFDAENPLVVNFDFDDIRVQQISRDPFVTAMTINGGLRRDVTVICRDRDNNNMNSSALYISGVSVIIEPIMELKLRPLPSNSSVGSIEVLYQPSVSPEVQHIADYCTSDGCRSVPFSGQGGVIMVNCTDEEMEVNVTVYVKNRCNQVSTPLNAITTIECDDPTSLPDVAVIVPTVFSFALLTYSIVLTFVGIFWYFKKPSNKLEGATLDSEHMMQPKS